MLYRLLCMYKYVCIYTYINTYYNICYLIYIHILCDFKDI